MPDMYCPRCSTKAVPGQRYCRSCGANLGAIWDAMEGKRGQIDFETLKADLKELGMNLRVGFEQAKENFKAQTNKLNQPNQTVQQNWWGAGQTQPPVSPGTAATPVALPPQVERELRKTLKDLRRKYRRLKLANTRKYSLQQGTLSILSGGAWMYVWKTILLSAAGHGVFFNLEKAIRDNTGWEVYGLVGTIMAFWLFGLIPIARGIGHLINGIFFAPSPDELAAESDVLEAPAPMFYYQPQPQAMPPAIETPSAISTNGLERELSDKPPASVVEDETKRFEA